MTSLLRKMAALAAAAGSSSTAGYSVTALKMQGNPTVQEQFVEFVSQTFLPQLPELTTYDVVNGQYGLPGAFRSITVHNWETVLKRKYKPEFLSVLDSCKAGEGPLLNGFDGQRGEQTKQWLKATHPGYEKSEYRFWNREDFDKCAENLWVKLPLIIGVPMYQGFQNGQIQAPQDWAAWLRSHLQIPQNPVLLNQGHRRARRRQNKLLQLAFWIAMLIIIWG